MRNVQVICRFSHSYSFIIFSIDGDFSESATLRELIDYLGFQNDKWRANGEKLTDANMNKSLGELSFGQSGTRKKILLTNESYPPCWEA